MTDNEIIKALECCTTNGASCKDCPAFVKVDRSNCKKYFRGALDLINRQNAEIEQLKANSDSRQINECESINIAHIKAEAYKEFVERSEKELFIKQDEHREHWMETLNRHRGTEAYKDHEWSIDNWLRGYGEAVQDILAINQNLLKEWVGEDG